jgi:hypothetical protein
MLTSFFAFKTWNDDGNSFAKKIQKQGILFITCVFVLFGCNYNEPKWTFPFWAPRLCRNPNLGLATKVRGYKVVGQEKDP